MPKGQPDFGLYAPTDTIAGISDLGELAARLGSIVTFDRRGNVLWYDDFESGIEAWEDASLAGGHSFSWEPTYHRSGGFCAKMATDAHTDDDVYIYRRLPYPILSKSAFEVSLAIDGNCKELSLGFYLYTGTNQLTGLLRWTASTGTWAYYGSDGTYHALSPTMQFYSLALLFNTLKLVCDFNNDQYVRLLVNNTVYDLSSIALHTRTEDLSPHLLAIIMLTTNTGAAATGYVDDAIVTQNEP